MADFIDIGMLRKTFGFMLAGSMLFCQTYNPKALAQAQLGVKEAQKAHYREAIEAYQHAIAIDPNLPGIYLDLRLAFFKPGKFHEAIAAFEKERAKASSDQLTTLLAMSY